MTVTIEFACLDQPLTLREPLLCKPCQVSHDMRPHGRSRTNVSNACRHCKVLRRLVDQIPHTYSAEPERTPVRDRTRELAIARQRYHARKQEMAMTTINFPNPVQALLDQLKLPQSETC